MLLGTTMEIRKNSDFFFHFELIFAFIHKINNYLFKKKKINKISFSLSHAHKSYLQSTYN